MNAILSAKAGLVIFIQGNDASVVSINDLESEIIYPVSSIRYLLAGVTDIQKIDNISKPQSIQLLQKEHDKCRALTLTLMLLDENEHDDTLELAVDCLKDLFADTDILNYVENTLYSNCLPDCINFARAIQYAEPITSLFKVLSEVEESQSLISKFRSQWDMLPQELFDDASDKTLYHDRLVVTGSFKGFVKAGNDSKEFSLAQLKCLTDLKTYRNSRAVVGQWLSGLAPGKVRTLTSSDVLQSKSNCLPGDKRYKSKISSRDAFLNAVKQKEGIFPLLKKGDWTKTRRYVEDLIKSQRENSEPEHVSKSLCDLAQHAKNVKNFSLQLELARRATEISVDDGWAHGQVADAYICLGQYDNAMTSFEQADIYGEYEFARTGYARILREQGRFEEAISAFEKLMVEFPDSDVIANCYCEVLRDVWRVDDALSVYNSSIEKFSYVSATYCGKASILKTIGRLDEALNIYQYARKMGEDTHYIGSGIADIFRIKGDYDRAIDEYDKVIKNFPEESIPKCSRANIFKIKDELPLALREYRSIAEEFPFDVSPREGIAETLREMNKYQEAMDIYDEILQQFPMANRARNGRANIFKCMGQHDKSLQAYEQNIKDFPYDIVSWSGRADLLKQLGFLDESIKAYEHIVNLNPYDKNYLYSIAAILAVKGEYAAALNYLPTEAPQTKEDWFAHHIKGMIYLKSGRTTEAINLFNDALRRVTSYVLAGWFKSALSIANLRQQDSRNAVASLINGSDGTQNEYVKNVLSIHAYGELGEIDKAEAAYIRIQNDCPPYITTLRDELALRYLKQFKILDAVSGRDLNWIYAEECNIVLLAA